MTEDISKNKSIIDDDGDRVSTFRPMEEKKQKAGPPWKKLIIGAFLLIFLCCILFAGFFFVNLKKIGQEKAPIEAVLDSFMTAIVAKDIDAAYALLSPRAQRQIPKSDIEKFTEGKNYVLFEGYQKIEVVNINISNALNTNPDTPQGIVAKVDGSIEYDDGFTGSFNATLEKVDGQWMIDGIFINVPPDKF